MRTATTSDSVRRPSRSDAIAALHEQSLRPARRVDESALGGRVMLQSLLDLSRAGELGKTHLGVTISQSDQIVNVIGELVTRAHTQVLNMLPGGPFPAQWLKKAVDTDFHLIEQVPIRSLYTAAVGQDSEDFAILAAYERRGFDIRIAEDLPHRLLIFDRACAILPVQADDETQGAIVVREPTMITSLTALYDSIWQHATSLNQFRRGATDGPSRTEKAILEMMSSGVTDEAACAKLGLSLRTYRRYIAALLTKLDAKTRFQAGTRAVERGWL